MTRIHIYIKKALKHKRSRKGGFVDIFTNIDVCPDVISFPKWLTYKKNKKYVVGKGDFYINFHLNITSPTNSLHNIKGKNRIITESTDFLDDTIMSVKCL
jgi:hypothetical protein